MLGFGIPHCCPNSGKWLQWLQVMRLLLEAGANADAAHKFAKSTALHFAAEMGQIEACRLLCQSGANPQAKKIQGGTPLHVAADSNQSNIAEVLVKVCKADTEALLLGDTTPLYLAAQKGFTEVVRVLLVAGTAANFVMPNTPMGSAAAMAANGHELPGDHDSEEDRMAAYFRGMHQEGSDPSAPGFEVGNGATALHAAVENGHIETVQMLLDHGVGQSGSMEGATPLILAAMYNQHAIAKVLIKEGAGLNDVVPDTGNSALYHAVGSGYSGLGLAFDAFRIKLALSLASAGPTPPPARNRAWFSQGCVPFFVVVVAT